ncbi:MAG: hypothetical protein OXG24_01785 [Gammaproteobacteria bacterium]|nr:hypothetical protein [Gammaproteobacteria bacterium]
MVIDRSSMRIVHILLLLWILQGCVSTTGVNTNCPGRGDLWSDEIWQICELNMPDSYSQCEEKIRALSAKDNPTLQDRFDLARFRTSLASREERKDHAKALAMYRQSRNELRVLAEEYPNSFDVLSELASVENIDSRRFAVQWRMMKLAPSCSNALFWLVQNDVGPYDWDRDPKNLTNRVTSERIEHRNRLLLHGYRYGPTKKKKLLYALMRFHVLRNDGDASGAQEFRREVIRQLGLEDLSFNRKNRAENLKLVCHFWAFGMGLAPLCVDAIEELLESDLRKLTKPNVDVLRAIRRLLHDVSDKLGPWQYVDGLPHVRYQYGSEIYDTLNRLQNAILQIPSSIRQDELSDIQIHMDHLIKELSRLKQNQSAQEHDAQKVDPFVLMKEWNP